MENYPYSMMIHMNNPKEVLKISAAIESRTTVVWKNMKRNQGTAWDDMPATRNSRAAGSVFPRES